MLKLPTCSAPSPPVFVIFTLTKWAHMHDSRCEWAVLQKYFFHPSQLSLSVIRPTSRYSIVRMCVEPTVPQYSISCQMLDVNESRVKTDSLNSINLFSIIHIQCGMYTTITVQWNGIITGVYKWLFQCVWVYVCLQCPLTNNKIIACVFYRPNVVHYYLL